MHQNNHYLAAGVAAKLWLVCWPQCTQCAVVISGHDKISYQMRRWSTPFQNHKSNQPAFSLLHLLGTINQDNDVVAKHFNTRDLLLKQACRQHISWFNSSGCVYFFFFLRRSDRGRLFSQLTLAHLSQTQSSGTIYCYAPTVLTELCCM